MKTYARRLSPLPVLLLILLILPMSIGYAQPETEEKVSSPGEYSGYTSPEYESWTTTSEYVTMRDGVRLAVDVHIPAEGPEREKFPSVLLMTPYHRASITDEGIEDLMDNPEAQLLSHHGYVIVVADIRGTGASFGYRASVFSPPEQEDGNDLLNWIVAEPWSDGNVGMAGTSYLATIQYQTASFGNPALKCIAPRYSLFDLYDVVYPGGLLDTLFISRYKLSVEFLDGNATIPDMGIWPSKPVDEDTDGSLLAQATEEHKQSFDMVKAAPTVPFRDSLFTAGDGTVLGYDDMNVAGKLQEIEDSGVAIYHLGGWFDGYTRDTLSMQGTMSNPGKLLMGPYFHQQVFESSAIEHLRWFDWCLKGIENGIDKEPPYYFYTMGRDEWRFADEWPLPEQKLTPYYFGPDNAVTTVKPVEAEAFDQYLTDYTSTSGSGTRWLCLTAGACEYTQRTELDKKNLTYTTPPLEQDLEVTGHPVVHLFVSSTAADGGFFVYLEDIDENGEVHYITEGELKASLRKLQPRPWKPDLPWPRSYAEDAVPLTPGQVEELVFDLQPTSQVFLKGHRLRVSIAGWDDVNFEGPRFDAPPTIRMYRDSVHASHIELPIIGEAGQIPLPPSPLPAIVGPPTTGSGPGGSEGMARTLALALGLGGGSLLALGGAARLRLRRRR